MVTAVHQEQSLGSLLREFISPGKPRLVGLSFLVLVAAQSLGLLALGTGRWGCSLSESLIVLGNLVALACAWIAFQRARGISSIFWFLFAGILLVWLVPNSLHAYGRLIGQNILSDSTWRLLYCLYGAPILMILFLPDTYEHARAKSEVYLDLFQIGIVVALVYSSFFFIPASHLQPEDAFLRNLSVSDAQSIVLMIAVLLRLQLARTAAARDLFRRFAIFLFVCAVMTLAGDWIDRHQFVSLSVWYNLVWALNQAAPALIAISWMPEPETTTRPEPARFINLLTVNLALVAMLVTINLLMDHWKQDHGELLTDIAITASLVAFTLRLALTQHRQQLEIFHRKEAQEQLAASNRKVVRLLDDSRRQTSEITQISELGSLLQACAKREEVFRLIPERMRRLFPDVSGSIFLLASSKNRLEAAASWGVGPVGQIISPTECWALRRGSTHVHPRGRSGAQCSHFMGEGASLCIPLVAMGEAIGVLTIQDNDFPSANSGAEQGSDHATRQLHLSSAVAEHIALAIANLGLRESLRVQAVRDPLTGLYNRRYMQEFLERELQSARRRHRPVAVMMLDLDHFKRYNDAFGHAAGDRTLAAVGEILLHSIRADDIACRYGGEEFALILPECSVQQAVARAESIRMRIAGIYFQPGERPESSMTISVGVAAFDETTDRVGMLLKLADDALYEAKRAGRNRVVQARPVFVAQDEDDREATPAPESTPHAVSASNSE
ncbi:MAG: sensor domain-containing diguanylate cyclase [Terriglobales bacterium]